MASVKVSSRQKNHDERLSEKDAARNFLIEHQTISCVYVSVELPEGPRRCEERVPPVFTLPVPNQGMTLLKLTVRSVTSFSITWAQIRSSRRWIEKSIIMVFFENNKSALFATLLSQNENRLRGTILRSWWRILEKL